MAAFANIRRESEKFMAMRQDFDNENEFNERASMMSMGGRERRTALGRGTVSVGSGGNQSTGPSEDMGGDPAVIRHSFMEALTGRSSTI